MGPSTKNWDQISTRKNPLVLYNHCKRAIIIIPVCQLDYFMYVRSLICIDECIGKIVLTALSENANYIIL